MKRFVSAIVIACMLTLGSSSAFAGESGEDRYNDNTMHPLQLAYYLVHPIGFTVEWLVGRPFQYIISRDGFRNVFGWAPLTEEATYKNVGQDL
jgi:hypothetical protein